MPRTDWEYFSMTGGCQDLGSQVQKWFEDGELNIDSIKPLIGTVKFHDVPDVMNARMLVDWEAQALRDKLLQSPSLLDHTHFMDTDQLMSMMSVKSKTFYYHVLMAQCINSPCPWEHFARVLGVLQTRCQPNTTQAC